ncbi:MAG: protein kinase domain-containing protein [Candidatus Acidiferrales bacterium]
MNPPMIGRTLGQYRVVQKLGAGGMGEVYRAADTRLGRDVALKFLPEVFARDPDRLARFEREAKLLASLNHPNIAAIYGLEEADGVRFLVLELVEGETLAERLASGSLPVEEAVAVCRQIAEGLESAHSKGIIHRDLKPANIKITPEGKVKVLDFGLAKAFEGEAAARDLSQSPTMSDIATRSGVVLGTAAYMSPEQARGKTVDTRTDIWAFGCVLYESLSGLPVFHADTVSDTVAGILRGEPDWQFLPAETPASLRRLLRRCLQKDAARRLQHMGDARLEIEEALVGPEEAPTIVAPRRDWRRLALLCAGSLLVGALAASLVVLQVRPPPGQAAMQFSVVTNFAGVEAQPTLSPDGRSVAFVSNRDGQYDIYVGLVTGGSLIRITSDPNLKARPRWSPDGSKIVYARLNETGLWDIWVVPALGGTPRRLIAGGTDPAWSPDGKQLAYAHAVAGTLWVADATGGNPRAVTERENIVVTHRQPAFSRDGRRLAFVRRGGGPYGELAVVEIESGKIQELTRDGRLALSPVWSPDDRSIYFASGRGGTVNIWKIAAAGGEPVPITAGQGADAELDLSADGRRLVFSVYRENQNLAEVDLAAPGKPALKWLTSDSARSESGPAYSPDGRRIAYFSGRQGTEFETIWVMEADGSNAVQLVDDGRTNVYPRWTPDGRELIYSSRPREMLFTSELEVRRLPLTGPPAEILNVTTASPLSGMTSDGRVLIMDATGRTGWREPGTKRVEWVNTACRRFPPPTVARGGVALACVSRASDKGEPEQGLWVYLPGGISRQVFRGWVVSFAWVNDEELIVVEGKPDLSAAVWRVWADGRAPARLPLMLPISYTFRILQPVLQFDVHPDGRRLVMSAHEVLEADIGMIENLPQ